MDNVQIERLDIKKHEDYVRYIDKNMRTADRIELEAFGHTNLYEAIKISISVADEAYIALNKDKALCIFGISCVQVGHGRAIWCIASKDLDDNAKAFLFYSSEIIAYWLKENPSVYNYVSVKNKRAIRWLKSIKAEFSDVVYINNEPFQMFIIRKEG